MIDCIYFLVLDILILSFLFDNFRLNKWIYIMMSLIPLLNITDIFFIHLFKHISLDIFIYYHITYLTVLFIQYNYMYFDPLKKSPISKKAKQKFYRIEYFLWLSVFFIMSLLAICLLAFDVKT